MTPDGTRCPCCSTTWATSSVHSIPTRLSRRLTSGLHPQLLTYNAHRSDGNNVGFNRVSTAAPNGITLYLWYAGTMNVATNGAISFHSG